MGRGKDLFPTNPRKDFKSFMGGVGGGEIPLLEYCRSLSKSARDDAETVMSNEVRHLRLFTF